MNEVAPDPSNKPHVVVSTGRYLCGLKCEAEHEDSGVTIRTAAPTDNNGDGSSFSPTDLVGAALGTCILTTMAIVAGREEIEVEGATFRVEKEMVAKPVRRIGRLGVRVTVPAGVTDAQLSRLEHVAAACPVHHSLHPDTKIELVVVRQGD